MDMVLQDLSIWKALCAKGIVMLPSPQVSCCHHHITVQSAIATCLYSLPSPHHATGLMLPSPHDCSCCHHHIPLFTAITTSHYYVAITTSPLLPLLLRGVGVFPVPELRGLQGFACLRLEWFSGSMLCLMRCFTGRVRVVGWELLLFRGFSTFMV